MIKPYYDDGKGIVIYHGDCREILPQLPKVDLVLTDPPYGLTENSWDKPIDPTELAAMFSRFRTVVMTASQPFSSQAVMADLKRFRHEWIWQKNRGSNFANTVREPFKEHEHILVFSDGQWIYNPQREQRRGSGSERVKHPINEGTASDNYRIFERESRVVRDADRVPSSVQKWNTEVGLHPTQKPVTMMSYLLRTYSNLGDTMLDLFMGSGSAIVAAKQLSRKAIGIEISEEYCRIAVQRLGQEYFQFSAGQNASRQQFHETELKL